MCYVKNSKRQTKSIFSIYHGCRLYERQTSTTHSLSKILWYEFWIFLLLSLKFNGTRFCDFHKIFSGEWLEVTMDKYYSFKNFRTSNLTPQHICQKNLVFDNRVQLSNKTERVLTPAHVRVLQSSFFGISRHNELE